MSEFIKTNMVYIVYRYRCRNESSKNIFILFYFKLSVNRQVNFTNKQNSKKYTVRL